MTYSKSSRFFLDQEYFFKHCLERKQLMLENKLGVVDTQQVLHRKILQKEHGFLQDVLSLDKNSIWAGCLDWKFQG